MNKRIEIERDTSKAARELISKQISKAVVNIRGDLPELITQILDTIDFDATQLRRVPKLDVILREDQINDLLDMLYTDLFVQYADAFALQDHLVRVRSLFDSTIISMINRVGEVSSKVRDYSTLAGQRFSFTDTAHETFNSHNNRSVSNRKVSVNPAAGIARLDGITEQYCTPEKSNVSLVAMSEGVREIDETESSLVYLNDPTEPYYITLLTNTYPNNQDYPVFRFSQHNGVIVDLVITFTGVFPINRVTFAPFSNASVEVIGMFHSDVPNAEWDGSDMAAIALPSVNYDNAEIELNFDRVNARELHILIRQDKFLLADEEVEVVRTYGVDEYIGYCSEVLRRAAFHGFTESEVITDQMEQLVEDITKYTALPVEKLTANTKSYVVGAYNLKAYNVQYNVVGEYVSAPKYLRGNLSAISMAYDGDLVKSDSGSTVDTAALFSAKVGNKELYMGSKDSSNIVTDAAVLEVNKSYVQGVMVPSETHLYKFSTHFIPDEEEISNMEVYADGERLSMPDFYLSGEVGSGIVTQRTDYGMEFEIPTFFALDSGIYDGSVLTLKYAAAQMDRFGRPYDTEVADVLGVLGKPNMSDSTSADIFSQFIYTVNSDPVSGVIDSRSYGPTEYTPIHISGEPHYCVYAGKGETLSSQIIDVNGKVYAHEDTVVGPFGDFYYGSIREDPSILQSGVVLVAETYDKYETYTPYVKGTLKVFSEGYYVPGVVEYDTDTAGTVLDNDEKKVFHVPESSRNNIRVSYIPVDSSVTSSSIDTNIAQHNFSERFAKTVDSKVQLTRYPFVDKSIVSSPNFDYSGGLFSLKYKYSVVYEPITIYVNGVKALNMTEYRTGTKPKFRDKIRQTDYQYYVENGTTVVFNEELSGNILIYYYILSDSFSIVTNMYRSNYLRDDMSPELYNYTVLANVQK